MAGKTFGSSGPGYVKPGMTVTKPKPIKAPSKPSQIVGSSKTGPAKNKPARPTKPMQPRKK